MDELKPGNEAGKKLWWRHRPHGSRRCWHGYQAWLIRLWLSCRAHMAPKSRIARW